MMVEEVCGQEVKCDSAGGLSWCKAVGMVKMGSAVGIILAVGYAA